MIPLGQYAEAWPNCQKGTSEQEYRACDGAGQQQHRHQMSKTTSNLSNPRSEWLTNEDHFPPQKNGANNSLKVVNVIYYNAMIQLLLL